jgi:hypothetical protein
MARPVTTDSHPICPTCAHVLSPEEAQLEYFASSDTEASPADDHSNLYEDAHKVINFLGALAQAAPRAVAQTQGSNEQAAEDWVMWLAWLADELTQEADRRISRLEKAGRIWRDRAGAVTREDSRTTKTRQEG